jgi:hypothetical protein
MSNFLMRHRFDHDQNLDVEILMSHRIIKDHNLAVENFVVPKEILTLIDVK